jgi:hypothetical protein
LFLVHVQIQSRSGPNRHPTLTTSLPATCSAKCVQGQHVFWTWRPCMDTTRPPPLLLSPAPLCTQRRAPERPPHPPPLPHSISLAWSFSKHRHGKPPPSSSFCPCCCCLSRPGAWHGHGWPRQGAGRPSTAVAGDHSALSSRSDVCRLSLEEERT